jgi:pyridinium-3,5-biscarboxylic acid mononucleotide synthase
VTVRYDYDRADRVGMPEAVLCLGKTPMQLRVITTELIQHPEHPVLFTRMLESQFAEIKELAGDSVVYEPESGTAVLHGVMPTRDGTVAVITAGTSDIGVAAEACQTLEFLGIATTRIVDVGVAGIWRLLERVNDFASADVVIVIAGMDAALASVVGGLTGQPVIAVPTSTGYGAAGGGDTALRAMLTSCAQGITVTNIDNGFGAACAASRILGPKRS